MQMNLSKHVDRVKSFFFLEYVPPQDYEDLGERTSCSHRIFRFYNGEKKSGPN